MCEILFQVNDLSIRGHAEDGAGGCVVHQAVAAQDVTCGQSSLGCVVSGELSQLRLGMGQNQGTLGGVGQEAPSSASGSPRLTKDKYMIARSKLTIAVPPIFLA